MEFRKYDPTKDKDAVHRIWHETGWLTKGKEEAMDLLVESGRASVADVNEEAECLVTTHPGTIRYLNEDLPFSCVSAVTTSRIARKQGFASRLTAEAVAIDAAEGALVSGLGMFEQGYYNQLGFGTGGYEHRISFDPSSLNIHSKPRVPRRITPEDWKIVHASRMNRFRGHGFCNLNPPEFTRANMMGTDNGFGLGYCDGPNGELTHHFWCEAKAVEPGPYHVAWMSFQNREEFLELMALIKNLGDQVRLVRMREPQGIQIQDILLKPFKQYTLTEKSKFESRMEAYAYWQMRICDLKGCLEKTHLHGDGIHFNLKLTDPIEKYLEKKNPWHGIPGDYVVTLGSSSGAEKGRNSKLSTLNASVGAFTRMWLGVRPASGLAVTDELSGPPELLEGLDRILRLPDPKPDWDF